MKNVKMTICLMAAVLFMAAGQGFGSGWIHFRDGKTHNINYQLSDYVRVDYQAPSMQTTVNLLAGGRIYCPYSSIALQGWNDSRINISGGSVEGELDACDRSQVTISSGSVNSLFAYDSSQITISGGSLGLGLYAEGSSQVTMSGGASSYLYTYGSGQITMSGGYVGDLYAYSSGRVTLSGGTIGSEIRMMTNAELIIKGFNFAIDGKPVGFDKITSILGGDCLNESYRTLTGTLANGDIINNQFRIGNYASITLVPEPATLLLFGLGAVMFRRKG